MRKFLCALALFLAIAAPLSAAAQENLRATIEAAVRSDPNSASLTDAEINELVDALYADASKENLTAEDITWRPVPADQLDSTQAECGFFCGLVRAFGLDGSDYTIPLMLGTSSLMLIFILGAVLEYRHFRHLHPKHAAAAAAPVAPDPMPPVQ